MNRKQHSPHAMVFAINTHASLRHKYGSEPYSTHLHDVAMTCMCYRNTLSKTDDIDTALSVAWLHDIISDCGISKEELSFRFSEEISDCVALLSEPQGKSRKEYMTDYLSLISTNRISVFVKLSDRISNVWNCIKTKDRRIKMYQHEHGLFKSILYNNRFKSQFDTLDALFEGIPLRGIY